MSSRESRKQALTEGKKRYHGRPCIKCSGTEKYVSNSSCVACTKKSTTERGPEVWQKYIKSDKGREWKKEFRKSSTYKNVQNKYMRESGKGREYASRRRDLVKEQYATLSEEQKNQIADVYANAAQLTCDTGIVHHVDHIIPLWEGGTHDPSNLQVLTADEHWQKCAVENTRRTK